MSEEWPNIWKGLVDERPQGDTLHARHPQHFRTERLLAALDSDGARHFLVRLGDSDPDFQDFQSRGIFVESRFLEVLDSETHRYIDIVCKDKSGYEAFNLVGDEIGVAIVEHGATAEDVVRKVLTKWRRFWGQAEVAVLSESELFGLFAEIWFLVVWLLPSIRGKDAIGAWRGPLAARHDFEWSKHSVEVKATTRVKGLVHRINGLDQLSPPLSGPLYFFSMRLRKEAGATNTLPGVIARCREHLQSEQEALDIFETRLNSAGYQDFHENEYAQVRIRVVNEGLYAVTEGFPRLVNESFPYGVPAGVECVDYEINLDGFDSFRMASNPAEANRIFSGLID